MVGVASRENSDRPTGVNNDGEATASCGEKPLGTVAAAGTGEGCRASGSSGMCASGFRLYAYNLGPSELSGVSGIDVNETQRGAGQIIIIPFSSPCLFWTLIHAMTNCAALSEINCRRPDPGESGKIPDPRPTRLPWNCLRSGKVDPEYIFRK